MKDTEYLYPLKFNPIYKQKIWGGSNIKNTLNRKDAPEQGCGESWEISTVNDNISVVSNGVLRDYPLDLLIRIFKHHLVGEKNYNEFKDNFPLLIKFIDAQEDLSIQVHPDNELALKRHDCLGKTEMWYIMDAEKDAKIINGFKKKVNKDSYWDILGDFESIYNKQKVAKGDVIFIPAGTVHAIGSGIMLAEIQQSSDITYRIHDYNRTDDQGNLRELHLEDAVDAIDFEAGKGYVKHTAKYAHPKVVSCPFFTTNHLTVENNVLRDYSAIDSFVVYMLLDGSAILKNGKRETLMTKGDVYLIPACLDYTIIKPLTETKMLEIHS